MVATARCAVFLPLLMSLPQPLALIEVGASAGLCLLPDRYGYDWGGRRIEPGDRAGPMFSCAVTGPVSLPSAGPRIVWRAGLDLNPLDPASDEDSCFPDRSVGVRLDSGEVVSLPRQTLHR